nr:hypothetical protein Iba_chr11bCG13150 [Ipomoea batatas]
MKHHHHRNLSSDGVFFIGVPIAVACATFFIGDMVLRRDIIILYIRLHILLFHFLVCYTCKLKPIKDSHKRNPIWIAPFALHFNPKLHSIIWFSSIRLSASDLIYERRSGRCAAVADMLVVTDAEELEELMTILMESGGAAGLLGLFCWKWRTIYYFDEILMMITGVKLMVWSGVAAIMICSM